MKITAIVIVCLTGMICAAQPTPTPMPASATASAATPPSTATVTVTLTIDSQAMADLERLIMIKPPAPPQPGRGNLPTPPNSALPPGCPCADVPALFKAVISQWVQSKTVSPANVQAAMRKMIAAQAAMAQAQEEMKAARGSIVK